MTGKYMIKNHMKYSRKIQMVNIEIFEMIFSPYLLFASSIVFCVKLSTANIGK